jgi:hypothetical protein
MLQIVMKNVEEEIEQLGKVITDGKKWIRAQGGTSVLLMRRHWIKFFFRFHNKLKYTTQIISFFQISQV